jgi:hypothetical protein
MFLLVVKEPVSVMPDMAVPKDMNRDLRDAAGMIMGIYSPSPEYPVACRSAA